MNSPVYGRFINGVISVYAVQLKNPYGLASNN
jgi:hypothetical protein